MKKEFKYAIFLIIAVILFIVYYITFKQSNVLSDFNDNEIIDLNLIDTVFFEDFNESNFTCTGLTYDSNDNSFWIADYGSLTGKGKMNPRLVEVDYELKEVVRILSLGSIAYEDVKIQGISYDKENNSILVATGQHIYNIDKEGKIINKINTKEYSRFLSNGLAYNNIDNSIWVLFYKKYLIHLDKDGNLIKKITVNYKDQDHLFINDGSDHMFISVGADFNGNNNFILEFDLINNQNYRLYRPIDSYAIEGISIVNNKLYVLNDGLYHSAKIKKSYINVYEFDIDN